MTRAEKFKEVFGLSIDSNMDCGFFDCSDKDDCNGCPVQKTMRSEEHTLNSSHIATSRMPSSA